MDLNRLRKSVHKSRDRTNNKLWRTRSRGAVRDVENSNNGRWGGVGSATQNSGPTRESKKVVC